MANLILVIEDDLASYHLMAAILQRRGYGVIHARAGAEGIDIALENQPDLILLDLRLPGINGFEVARRFKNHPKLHHIPILAVSVATDARSVREAIASGCDEFIHKPFDVNKLQAHIRRFALN